MCRSVEARGWRAKSALRRSSREAREGGARRRVRCWVIVAVVVVVEGVVEGLEVVDGGAVAGLLKSGVMSTIADGGIIDRG